MHHLHKTKILRKKFPFVVIEIVNVWEVKSKFRLTFLASLCFFEGGKGFCTTVEKVVLF